MRILSIIARKLEFLFGFALRWPFLFHLAQDLCHVFHFFPNFPTYVNGGALLCRHGNAVARSRVDLDDFPLMQFVFGAHYHSSEISTAFKIVDHDPLNLCSQGPENMSEKIMSQRTLFMRTPHKHRDRLADALVHINHEHFLAVAGNRQRLGGVPSSKISINLSCTAA